MKQHTLKNGASLFPYLFIFLSLSVSCSRHDLPEEEAEWLACGGCVQNHLALDNRKIFNSDETTIYHYDTYRDLEKKGFLIMTEVTDTDYEYDYYTEWLSPTYEYVDDSMLSDNREYYRPIVRTFDYEEVEILGSTLHEAGYYEIDFVIVGIKPTPFSELHGNFDKLNKSGEHRKCYAKLVDEVWNIDYLNTFD